MMANKKKALNTHSQKTKEIFYGLDIGGRQPERRGR